MIIPVLLLALAAAPGDRATAAMSTLSNPAARALTEHMRKGFLDAAVGQWVTYRLDGGYDRVSFWRIAIVGEEVDVKGRPAFWVEMEHGEHHAMKAPLAQFRLLVTKDLGFTKEGITRAFVAFGADKPMEFESEALESVMNSPSGAPVEPEKKQKGFAQEQVSVVQGKEQSLLTPAGTVSALPIEVRYRNTVIKRIWTSRQVPLFHLAKIEVPAIDNSMDVREFGLDAKPMMVLPPPEAQKLKVVPYNEVTKSKEDSKP